MLTPFDERGEVDPEATEEVVNRFIEAEVDDFSSLGSTGELLRLGTLR
jgi:dihydrodipicolinate synthase/N-acetylneuraminate lyase